MQTLIGGSVAAVICPFFFPFFTVHPVERPMTVERSWKLVP